MKKLIIVYVVLIVAVILLAVLKGGDLLSFLPSFGGGRATAKIGEKTIQLEVADNDAERQKGLSGRDSLAEDHGMVFLFDTKDKYSFWMKDTRISLDIIYIDGETVEYLVKNAPSSLQAPNLTIYTSDVPVDKVLELNAGQADKLGISKGTKIEFNGL